MSLELQLSNLQSYYNRIEIIEQTANQIIKDFDAFGYEITFSGNAATAYNELFNQINPLISALIDKNYKKLMSILYRIDISEEKISKKLSEVSPTEFAEIITEMVIERELKKVITRNYYKNR